MNLLLNFVWVPLYDISLRFYQLALILASPFNTRAKQWISGRKNWKEKLKNINWRKGKRIWFHCASLGEFEQARPVLEKWGCLHPNDSIILTFFSPSGFEVRKNYECADLVLYLPLDTPLNASLFIEYIKPDIALFVKYEFWFHYLHELKKKKITSILFSSVFREEQIFFKWYGGFFRQMLTLFTRIFVQNEESKQLLQKISIGAEVNFDTRFDRVYEIAQRRQSIPYIENFKGAGKIFIAGSTWRKDEEMILYLIRENVLPGYKYIVVPHQVDPFNISALQKAIPLRNKLLSALTADNANEVDLIIVDSLGLLSSLYQYGDIAYVGGGFNKSVHNVLEAAVYDIPVVFGPNYKKSLEALELLRIHKAFSFTSNANFIELVRKISDSQKNSIQQSAGNGENYVSQHLGGSKKIIDEMGFCLR